MGSPLKVRQDRKRRGLCVGCGGKPKVGKLRCESCLAKQRAWDKAYRKGLKGGVVEPQCKLPDGKMRADHVFGPVDGLCACGARKMEFALRPPLRPEVLRTYTSKRTASGARLLRTATPAAVAPARQPTGAKPRAQKAPPDPTEPALGIDYRGVIAALELERDELEIAIGTLRRLQERKP
jgi:hypothetical protein